MTSADSTERKVRTKRRIGCGFFFFLFLVMTAVIGGILFVVFLRPNPNPPLEPWIPPDSDAAASIQLDFSGEALGGLARILLVAEGTLKPQERDQILTKLDDLVRMAVYPRILAVGRIEPNTLEMKWAVVGNVRRGQNLLEPLTTRLLGDEVRWVTESVNNQPVKKVQLPSYGLEGMLHGSQLVVSNNPSWLNRTPQAQSASTRPLANLEHDDVPIAIAIDDRQGQVREALRQLAEMKSDPDIAMAADYLHQLLSQSGGKMTIDLWLLVKEARAIISPSEGASFNEPSLIIMAGQLQKDLGELLGVPQVQLAKVIDHNGRKSLEIHIPAFGYMLGQAFAP